MSKYIKIFNTDQEYTTARSEGFAIPNLSYIKDTEEVKFNEIPEGCFRADINELDDETKQIIK